MEKLPLSLKILNEWSALQICWVIAHLWMPSWGKVKGERTQQIS